MKYIDDTPELGEYVNPYPKNKPSKNLTKKINTGKLIVFEGLDGSGKSSQTKNVYNYLKDQGKKVYTTNFIHSPFIKQILLKSKWENVDPHTSTLLYTMALTNTYNTEIALKLEEGYIVVLDRYIYTILSKALVREVDKKWVKDLVSHFRQPDLEIYVDTDPEECLKRKKIENKILSYWECGADLLGKDEEVRFSYNQKEFDKLFLKYQMALRRTLIDTMQDSKVIVNGTDEEKKVKEKILKIIDCYLKDDLYGK